MLCNNCELRIKILACWEYPSKSQRQLTFKAHRSKYWMRSLSACSMDSEILDIPELHVTSLSGNDFLSESFETGLQMLHTLEQQQYVSYFFHHPFTRSSTCKFSILTIRMNNSATSEASIATELVDAKNELQELRSLKRKRKWERHRGEGIRSRSTPQWYERTLFYRYTNESTGRNDKK